MNAQQRRILAEALHLGYFDSPPSCTIADVAQAVGTNRTAAAIHLRTATHEAVERAVNSAEVGKG